MNYLHAYHAGNFADVVKHVTLISLLTAFIRKPTSFCYIDTHAGGGYYDLSFQNSSKNKEYISGIKKIIQGDNPPPIVKRYLDCIHHINNQLTQAKFASLRYYPGSPMIARYFARAQDRLIACELHPEEYQNLKKTFVNEKRIAIHHMDGFLGLKAFLPPKERRGLILIDPPYEDPDEFTRINLSLLPALKRFQTGVYAIWYPIKEKIQVHRFYETLKENMICPMLAIELTIYPDLPNHLNGCGMVILNPPWKFDSDMNHVLPWLWKTLSSNAQGGFRLFSLT